MYDVHIQSDIVIYIMNTRGIIFVIFTCKSNIVSHKSPV